jgi:hypothetical protein
MLLADQAFPDQTSLAIAKTGVLLGSLLAAILGAVIIATNPLAAITAAQTAEEQGIARVTPT